MGQTTFSKRNPAASNFGFQLIILMVGAMTSVLVVGCAPATPTYTGLDPDRILHMAGEEAGQIDAPYERLTRQLNIANRQTINGRADEARGHHRHCGDA